MPSSVASALARSDLSDRFRRGKPPLKQIPKQARPCKRCIGCSGTRTAQADIADRVLGVGIVHVSRKSTINLSAALRHTILRFADV